MLHLEQGTILYFEPPTKKLFSRGKVRAVRSNIHVRTLPRLMVVDQCYPRAFERSYKKLAKAIQKAADRHRMDNPILWCTAPWQVHLLPHLAVKGVVYDCYQSWHEYSSAWEQSMAEEADVVFVASQMLARRLSEFHQNFVTLPNGVDEEQFQMDEEVTFSRPTQRCAPVLGYGGHLWADLDLGPVEAIAQAHPEWRIVLFGEDYGNPWVEVLEEYPNIRFMGCCSQEEVAFLLNRLDICLHLLRRSDEDTDVLGSHYYEYLTTGNPIVSMLFPDQVEPYPDVVYGAHSDGEFVQLCEHALHEVGAWARARRIAYGMDSHWSNRANGMKQLLQTIGFYKA